MTFYGVVTMDIVDSRNLYKRETLQNKLLGFIEQMNNKHRCILAVPISVTLGDEWQLITNKPSDSYNLVHEFQQLFWKDKIDFYAGIGIGEISTMLYNDIRKMDGPCFHMARDAVNIAKKQIKGSGKYIFSKQNRVFLKFYEQFEIFRSNGCHYKTGCNDFKSVELEEAAITFSNDSYEEPDEGKSRTLDNIINTIIENNEILKSKMTMKQRKVYIDYLKYGTYRNTIKFGGYYNESIGGISQKLNSAEFFTIQRNYEMVSWLIDYYCALKEVKN